MKNEANRLLHEQDYILHEANNDNGSTEAGANNRRLLEGKAR